MNLLFLLKLDHPDLAAAEAKAAVRGWRWWSHPEGVEDGTLLLSASRVPEHLALTHRIVRVAHAYPVARLLPNLRAVNWGRIIKGSYRISLTKAYPHKIHERDLAGVIWDAAKGEVDLHEPDTHVEVVLTKRNAYVGVRAWEDRGGFEARRAHLWPSPHPSALHPRLASALVRVAASERIHDPFCGGGGILIEAGLQGVEVSGADIDPAMVARAKRNCTSFGVRPQLRVADALEWLPQVQAIVTDLPYGKSTKLSDIDGLRRAFLAKAGLATSRIVVGLPKRADRFPGWHVRAHFMDYVHKSLTRHFYVLEPVRVVAFGTFDGLHPGHEHYLQQAMEHGSLTVIVARDETVREVKGRLPRFSEQERLVAVQRLPYVNQALLGYPGDKHRIVRELEPDVICLGYDQRAFTDSLAAEFPGAKIVRIAPFHPERYKSSLRRSPVGTRSPRPRASSRRR